MKEIAVEDRTTRPGASARGPEAAADARRGIDPAALVPVVERLFGAKVEQITAPGGRRRDSVRVFIGGRTLIATRRERADRRAREAAFLSRMADAGAPVPRLLAQEGAFLFQSDAGSRRLAWALESAEGTAREALVGRVFESLWRIKEAARRCGLRAAAEPVALNARWLGHFATAARDVAHGAGIAAPRVGWNALAQSLAALPTEFVKWDARPNNAALDADGQPIWFDWEHYGRRAGVEDFAFLMADEFWSPNPETSLRLFRDTAPAEGRALEPLLVRFATVQVTARMRLVQAEWRRNGWIDAAKALRYDYIGAAPELFRRLCRHGAALAERDPLTRPLSAWFQDFPDPADWPSPAGTPPATPPGAPSGPTGAAPPA